MGAKKVKELGVKTGSYTVNGEEKARWKNVGSMMKGDDGSYFLLLDTTFNPAGVPNPDNRDNVLISVFDLRDESGERPPQRQVAPAQRQAPASQVAPAGDSDIPFS